MAEAVIEDFVEGFKESLEAGVWAIVLMLGILGLALVIPTVFALVGILAAVVFSGIPALVYSVFQLGDILLNSIASLVKFVTPLSVEEWLLLAAHIVIGTLIGIAIGLRAPTPRRS